MYKNHFKAQNGLFYFYPYSVCVCVCVGGGGGGVGGCKIPDLP